MNDKDCLTKCLNYEGCRIDLNHFESECKTLRAELIAKDKELALLRSDKEALKEHWKETDEELGETQKELALLREVLEEFIINSTIPHTIWQRANKALDKLKE